MKTLYPRLNANEYISSFLIIKNNDSLITDNTIE